MEKLKRILKLFALLLMIGLSSVLAVPITFYRKDDLPKYLIEQVDTKEDDIEEDDIKELS